MFHLFKQENTEASYPPVTLFNTETRQDEVFEPLSKKEVKIYTCGPTVYDYAHIGNLRTYVFSDILVRTLEYNGYTVNNTINFTDFGHLTSDADTGEDKMMKGLKRENLEVSVENMRLLSDRYIKAFKEDMESLNILSPKQFSRASDYISEQIALIKTLEERGYTYTTSDGVYFEISKFPTYGRLGKIDIEGLRSGTRVEINTEKKHPADFAVWKNGELGWDSKWGKGFPGWHIECSAMAFATLGKQIDIHTGGIDNIATHHNGEIAQCESATGKQFSKYWMHSEHLQIDNQKIAKSDGNSLHLSDLSDGGIDGDHYRYWLLTAHYRSKINLNMEALQGSKQALIRLKRLVYEEWAQERGKLNEEYHKQFVSAINNDLDTPKAISIIWDLVKDDSLSPGEKRMTIVEFDHVLAIGLSDEPEIGLASLGYISQSELPEDIQELVHTREAARIAQNWAESDRLREALLVAGYTIEDGQNGPKITKN